MAIKISNNIVIDDSKNINAGVVTATSFVGNGSQLTGIGATIVNDTSTNATYYPLVSSTTSGSLTAAGISSSKLTFNPSTGKLTVTGFTASSDSVLPVGNVAARVATQGSIRYNSEYFTLEFYDGTSWLPIAVTQFVTDPANTGVFGGGLSVSGEDFINHDTIDYITIATTGNATNFGDLTVVRGGLAACSSSHGGL